MAITPCRAIGWAALGLALLAAGASAQDFDSVRIETHQLGGGLAMLTGRGGNIGVSIGADGVFLIDDQFAPLTPKIVSAVRGLSEESIRFVFNTHWHSDHTGGNEALGRAGAVIVAHRNTRERMSVPQFMKLFGREVPASPKRALPVITFREAITFHLNGIEIEVFHAKSAHTDGDAIIYFKDRGVVHMGDVYFNGSYPFIDLESGGSVNGVIAAVDRVLALSDKPSTIIPGHGPLSDRAQLEQYREMLSTVRSRVAAGIASEKTVDQVIASRPAAEFDPRWGSGFIKSEAFVRTVYQSLGDR